MFMLSVLKEWTEANMNKINDLGTLNEMLTFTLQVKKMKGIWWGAEAGANDDRVMALAICLQGREQQECEEIPEKILMTGFFYPEELEMGLNDGRFSYEDVYEYKQKHTFCGEKYSNIGISRSNRYARD